MPIKSEPSVSIAGEEVVSQGISHSWRIRARQIVKTLGSGLVTGASDDDPSGIATYSQVGAQFGYGLLWTMVLTYPLMAAIQEISARMGRTTGCGISANLRKNYPSWLLYIVIAMVLAGNIFNLGADIGAMGAAAQLLASGPMWSYILLFGIVSLLLQLFVPYSQYVNYLKWLTLSLFAYIATAFLVHLSWRQAAHASVYPTLIWSKDYLMGDDRRARNNNQPIPVLLAGFSGGRGS